jgi:acyl-CoA dehydrogenase
VSWDVVQELRAAARDAGVYGPHLPTRLGGLGLDWRGVAVAFEEAGTSCWGRWRSTARRPTRATCTCSNGSHPAQQERYSRRWRPGACARASR